jgi:hypothetical protein
MLLSIRLSAVSTIEDRAGRGLQSGTRAAFSALISWWTPRLGISCFIPHAEEPALGFVFCGPAKLPIPVRPDAALG